MVFKLIRVDTEEPSKIQLDSGKHIIGRGKLRIDSSDKRVSRNHAELHVSDDFIALKALHQNPCFFIKKNTLNKEILEQNSTTYLSNGDKFGLIPDNFWYEVVNCLCPENPDIDKDKINESNIHNAEGDTNSNMTEIVEPNEETQALNNTDKEIKFEANEEVHEPDRTASPSLLGPAPMEGSPSHVPSSPSKRSHDSCSSSPEDVKRVKTEPVTPDAKAGPSNDQAASNSDSKDQKPDIGAPALAAKPAAPLRERCMYGANCYRRNPQHKAQFSHPSDSDWGAGDRGVCPYGSACRKMDPRHWQQNEHPPGVNPPDPSGRRPGQVRRKQRKQKRVSESEDDGDNSGDSAGGELIVTGKRKRKPINTYNWDYSESDGPEDPFGTDESDEWQPSGDITNSGDYSQKF